MYVPMYRYARVYLCIGMHGCTYLSMYLFVNVVMCMYLCTCGCVKGELWRYSLEVEICKMGWSKPKQDKIISVEISKDLSQIFKLDFSCTTTYLTTTIANSVTDQLGLLFKSLCNRFCSKSSHIISVNFWAIFKNRF